LNKFHSSNFEQVSIECIKLLCNHLHIPVFVIPLHDCYMFVTVPLLDFTDLEYWYRWLFECADSTWIFSKGWYIISKKWYIINHQHRFDSQMVQVSNGKLLDSLPKSDAEAELCSGKFQVAYCHDLEWKLPIPQPYYKLPYIIKVINTPSHFRDY
jgi:hypothetical protein